MEVPETTHKAAKGWLQNNFSVASTVQRRYIEATEQLQGNSMTYLPIKNKKICRVYFDTRIPRTPANTHKRILYLQNNLIQGCDNKAI